MLRRLGGAIVVCDRQSAAAATTAASSPALANASGGLNVASAGKKAIPIVPLVRMMVWSVVSTWRRSSPSGYAAVTNVSRDIPENGDVAPPANINTISSTVFGAAANAASASPNRPLRHSTP